MSSAVTQDNFEALTLMLDRFKDAEERLKELEATEAQQEKVLDQRNKERQQQGASAGGDGKKQEENKIKEDLQNETAWKKSQTECLKKDAPEGGLTTIEFF